VPLLARIAQGYGADQVVREPFDRVARRQLVDLGWADAAIDGSAMSVRLRGVAGLTKTVALEVAEQGITVNAICPGYVLTPLVEKQIPDTAKTRGITEEQVVRDVLLAAQSTKQFVTVGQVASLARYLASDDAASITGAILSVDGGWTAH